MTETPATAVRKALTTPRAAAVAGILFAILYGTSLILIRLSIPPDPTADSAWMAAGAERVTLALNLVPYAGIAFLWFIAVIRDRLGVLEDRFFATVFLGSGLLFLAMTFAGAALAGGLLSSFAVVPSALLESGVSTYGRAVVYQVLNIYAVRMAGVFMISVGTIWLRTGSMHRAWPFLTYALALASLLSISLSLWMNLIFPGWVLAVSVHFLIRSPGNQPQEV